jgi:hypothetical protein
MQTKKTTFAVVSNAFNRKERKKLLEKCDQKMFHLKHVCRWAGWCQISRKKKAAVQELKSL